MGLFRKRAKAQQSSDDADFALEAEVDTILAIRAAGKGDIHWGAPTRCPVCAVYGFVEEVDRQRGRTENRCLARNCGAEWVVTRRGLREARRRMDAGEIVPGGSRAPAKVDGAVPIPTDSPLSSSPLSGAAPGWAPEELPPRSAVSSDPLDRFEVPPPPPSPIGIDWSGGASDDEDGQDTESHRIA